MLSNFFCFNPILSTIFLNFSVKNSVIWLWRIFVSNFNISKFRNQKNKADISFFTMHPLSSAYVKKKKSYEGSYIEILVYIEFYYRQVSDRTLLPTTAVRLIRLSFCHGSGKIQSYRLKLLNTSIKYQIFT